MGAEREQHGRSDHNGGLEAEWARLLPLLQKAFSRAPQGHTLDDIREEVRRGETQLWAGRRSVIVTEIYAKPRGDVLNYWLVAGDRRELRQMQPLVEAWARSRGATHRMGAGRPGFHRMFPGFRPVGTVYYGEL